MQTKMQKKWQRANERNRKVEENTAIMPDMPRRLDLANATKKNNKKTMFNKTTIQCNKQKNFYPKQHKTSNHPIFLSVYLYSMKGETN